MDRQFKEALAKLNAKQKQAVETIDGPALVIAGPGTGKTQLISTRVGYILQQTDTPADAILLLTFTEAGVQAMRERLTSLMGRAAYDVQLSTYHAFGGEIFRRYPDYFEGLQLNLIEDLSADSLLRGLIAKLPYSNPLKFADNYIADIQSFISDCKQALLAPKDVAALADANLKFIAKANRSGRKTLDTLTRVSPKSVPIFEELLEVLSGSPAQQLPLTALPLADYASQQLRQALDYFVEHNKATELTKWKNVWLAKDADGRFILDGQRLNQRLAAAAGLYAAYEQSLRQRQQYDYDDMILRAIAALETNPELKHSLAERYSYIMLDEFQDTNPAQFRLVELLTDHPVHEGRPNVLAVGDDDQAIYAFQGAEHANMAAFAQHYKDVKLVSLEENYRSWPPLLEAAQNISKQIQERLQDQLKGIDKHLVAANKQLPEPPNLSIREFISDAAQFEFVAKEVEHLIKRGMPASEIAVLAPKHRYLQPLLPYLSARKLPVRYERRENVLDEPLIYQLEQMSRLVIALSQGNETLANSLWPEVLSYEFWKVPTDVIWRLNWQLRQSHEPWTAMMLNQETLGPIADFFLRLSAQLPLSTLEQQLDALIGLPDPSDELVLPFKSPVYEFYFSKAAAQANPFEFTKLISDLSVLRSRLRDWRRSVDEPLGLKALVEFIDGHRAANLNILNTSPYHEQSEAINLLTAYGAKGREFRVVFIVAALDEVWGSASRNQGYRLALPANLSYIRYQGASEDERLRLLYVAATRAQTQLYFTSYRRDLAGKAFNRLKYLDVEDTDKGALSRVLPEQFAVVITDDNPALSLTAAANYWSNRHLPPLSVKLKDVLKPRLERYQLSATHLNKFLDIVNGGPDAFFMDCVLNFPSAPTQTSAFGTAIHNSLRFAGNILASEGQLPSQARLSEIFEAQLGRIELATDEQANLVERGRDSLDQWLAQRGKSLNKSDFFEYDFQNEGSFAGPARLAGKVDRLIIDEKTKSITVVDYKTGQSYQRWQGSVIKLHKFRQQLLFYKLLVENSARFRGYTVTKGLIEFVEPDESGRINQLELIYEPKELATVTALCQAVWQKVQTLDLPDTSAYAPTLAGIKQFEQDLIDSQ